MQGKKVTIITKHKAAGRQAMADLARMMSPEQLLASLYSANVDTDYIIARIKYIIENGGSMAQIEGVRMFAAMMVECRMVATDEGMIADPAAPGSRVDKVIDQMVEKHDADEESDNGKEAAAEDSTEDGNTFGDSGRFGG